MKKVVFWMLLLSLNTAQAAIYMQKDQNGSTTYSDTPSGSNSTPVDLPDQTVTEPPVPVTPALSSVSGENLTNYTTFHIVSPADQASIQNQVVIPVQIALKPDLQPGDTIQIWVDGKPASNPSTSTTISLENVIRGTHQITAMILDKNHKVKQEGDTVTIFFHRAGTQSPARGPQASANMNVITHPDFQVPNNVE
jgi:hypothetical protein